MGTITQPVSEADGTIVAQGEASAASETLGSDETNLLIGSVNKPQAGPVTLYKNVRRFQD